jgi:hypothetical protein
VERVIDLVNSITRIPCDCCYIRSGKADKRYCFGFGLDPISLFGKYPEAASFLEVLEKEEVKAIFRAYDEEGLMVALLCWEWMIARIEQIGEDS